MVCNWRVFSLWFVVALTWCPACEPGCADSSRWWWSRSLWNSTNTVWMRRMRPRSQLTQPNIVSLTVRPHARTHMHTYTHARTGFTPRWSGDKRSGCVQQQIGLFSYQISRLQEVKPNLCQQTSSTHLHSCHGNIIPHICFGCPCRGKWKAGRSSGGDTDTHWRLQFCSANTAVFLWGSEMSGLDLVCLSHTLWSFVRQIETEMGFSFEDWRFWLKRLATKIWLIWCISTTQNLTSWRCMIWFVKVDNTATSLLYLTCVDVSLTSAGSMSTAGYLYLTPAVWTLSGQLNRKIRDLYCDLTHVFSSYLFSS